MNASAPTLAPTPTPTPSPTPPCALNPAQPHSAGWSQDAKTIALVSTAHATSHFFHLILAPLFPWLKVAFDLSYVQLGLLMTVFFVVSGVGQAMAGFLVDKVGPRVVLFYAIAGFAVSALVLSFASSYAVLMLGAAMAGASNCVFHPADFSILNHRVSPHRLAYAFTAHGLSGNLGWAIATGLLAGVAAFVGWREALQVAAVMAVGVWALLWWGRDAIYVAPSLGHNAVEGAPTVSAFAFLGSSTLWFCFAFFTLATMGLSGFQTFGSTILKTQYGFSQALASQIITLYLVCGAVGMVAGGWLATRIARNDRQIALAYGFSALGACMIALNWIPVWLALFFIATLGFAYGLAGPSRDLLIKRATPKGAVGRMYGVVYSGADVGFALGPIVCGYLVDHGATTSVFWAVAVFQTLAIACAWRVGRRQTLA